MFFFFLTVNINIKVTSLSHSKTKFNKINLRIKRILSVTLCYLAALCIFNGGFKNVDFGENIVFPGNLIFIHVRSFKNINVAFT